MISQVGPGLNGPTGPTNVVLVPSISQIAGVPSSPCQMMSDLPSPLKSPVPLISQFGPGLNGPMAPTKVLLVPSISHAAAVPSLLCHRMSDLLSPSKSFVGCCWAPRMSVSVAVLLVGAVSVSPVGANTEAVLVSEPMADGLIWATAVKMAKPPGSRVTGVEMSPKPLDTATLDPGEAMAVQLTAVMAVGNGSIT